MDQNGKAINRNRLIALISAILLEESPGATIVTDSVTSSGLTRFITEWGGVHYRYKRGHQQLIEEAVRLNDEGIDCPLAIETSGHAAFRENYFLDDGVYLVTRLLCEAMDRKREGLTLASLIDELAELLNANVKAPVGIVMGNHEYYNWDGDQETAQAEFSKFLGSKLAVEGAFQVPGGPNEGELDCDFVVGGDGTEGSGYHVLAVSPHVGGYDNSWYGDRQDWIREHLEAAAAEDPEKPIFLFTHHPFGNTVWYSVGGSWNGQFGLDETDDTGDDMAFYQELAAAYPQLVHFSGHTHIPMADPRSIYQDDGFTLIQTATFANNFWMAGDGFDEDGDEGGHPAAGQDANQCELVEIDTATNAVTVYRLDFREGAVIGEPWTIVPSEGVAGFKYTYPQMKEASQPPVVAADATVTCDGASFTLTADKVAADTDALANDVVISYRVAVAPADDAENAVFEALYMSDYYKASADRAAEFTRPLFGAELEAGTDYVLAAYAVNAFGKEALVGEAEFTA